MENDDFRDDMLTRADTSHQTNVISIRSSVTIKNIDHNC